MKKLCALMLVLVMALGMLPFAVSADEAITIEPYGTGWENWSGQTQLLIMIPGVTVADGMATTWEITLNDGTASKTINLKPSSNYEFAADNVLFRFETCLGEGANQFVPTAGASYTVSVKGTVGETVYVGTAAEGTTWDVAADLVPVVPATPEWPVEMTLNALYGKIENYGNKEKGTYATCMIVGWSNTDGEAMAKVFEKVKAGTYAVKVIITDETADKEYTIEKYAFDHAGTGSLELYGKDFLRIIPGDYGIVLEKDHAYTVEYVITENGEVRYNAASEEGAFAGGNDAFKSEGAVIPETVPHPDGEVEPPVPAGPVAITIAPKFGKWENWINSPNNPNGVGAEPGVTQLLVGITDANGAKIDIDAALVWKVTISAGDESKTLTMAPATKALDYDLYRFETCLGEGDNKFVPVNGTDYTVQITVLGEDGTELYKSEAVSGFTCPMDPVVPEEEPVDPPVVEPPVEAGDATALIAVLAVVALFGAAVVTKKVFVK